MTRTVVIPDEWADFEITGEVIAGPVSTEIDAADRARPRWYQVTLYRKPAAGGYVLAQVNLSRVWHLDASHVRKPGPVQRSALPAGAVYCGSLPGRGDRDQCPPRHGSPEMAVMELPQHKVSAHPDAAAVIREAMTARRGASVSMSLSEPMRDLLTEAEDNDPAFRGARARLKM